MTPVDQLSGDRAPLCTARGEFAPSVNSGQELRSDRHAAEPADPRRIRRERNARLVVFSGVDCSGKSTQISLLIELLRERGEKPFYFWSRVGYTPVFHALKTVLRRTVGEDRLPQGASEQRDRFLGRSSTRRVWLWVAFADMVLQTALRLRLLRLLGRTVVCDRYIDDSENDLIMNFDESATRLFGWRLVKALAAKPDVSILLDLPFEEALHRSVLKNEPFADSEERRLRRAGLYESMRRSGSYAVIDARRSIDGIAAEVRSLVFAGELGTAPDSMAATANLSRERNLDAAG